jgi:CheY-like chemotaxis protein
MMNIEFSFIIIDDSELDRYVTQKFLERTDGGLIIKTFSNATAALEMIREDQCEECKTPIIILLDLQMPVMNGYNFVEEFEKFHPKVQKNYMIIVLTVLSSTSDPNDIHRILTHPVVNSVIEKPLTKEKLITLLAQVRSNI